MSLKPIERICRDNHYEFMVGQYQCDISVHRKAYACVYQKKTTTAATLCVSGFTKYAFTHSRTHSLTEQIVGMRAWKPRQKPSYIWNQELPWLQTCSFSNVVRSPLSVFDRALQDLLCPSLTVPCKISFVRL